MPSVDVTPLEAVMLEKKLSAVKLAKLAEVSRHTVSTYMGMREPKTPATKKMAKRLMMVAQSYKPEPPATTAQPGNASDSRLWRVPVKVTEGLASLRLMEAVAKHLLVAFPTIKPPHPAFATVTDLAQALGVAIQAMPQDTPQEIVALIQESLRRFVGGDSTQKPPA